MEKFWDLLFQLMKYGFIFLFTIEFSQYVVNTTFPIGYKHSIRVFRYNKCNV
jgi:hypothetical protein